MNRTKRARLEARVWRIGSAADFLELTPEEAAFVETKLALTQTLRERRTAQHLTQHALAKLLSSSQSRIAKMEAGDSSVSVDLLLRALFALGAKPRDIANALQRRRRVLLDPDVTLLPRHAPSCRKGNGSFGSVGASKSQRSVPET